MNVRLDTDLRSTHIHVIGLVTPNNLQALYAIARRANTLQPGMNIFIDLSRARVKDEALADLQHVARSHRLPRKLDPQSDRCQIRIVEPTAA
ncbi:hypothetical protein [Arthrobacter crystallopoietes]|uniref:hypothetical protein n=1 Tax=Crystallibacter crystallopoietes TaxID=37928 RepID=UPI0011115013|nr:hypothetical protein [Arthrobacter crystallopoietes]